MSYKDDHQAHKVEQEQRAYVAAQLGLTADEIADCLFDVEEDMQQGEVVSWTVYWQDRVPEGIEAKGNGGTLWTTVLAPSRT